MQEVQAILPLGSIVRDRYVVEDCLGKGGFGAVYLVRDLRVKHNLFALKEVIDPDRRERNRFLFEGELLKRLDHRALARVYRVFDEDTQNRAYMLMDYIDGPNLETLRQQQPGKRFSFPQVLTIMAPIMDAVNYLHSQQPPIVHRDIKPSNIIVPTTGDDAVLVDFGVAKEYNPDSTTTAIRRCSPGYAAPEQYGKGSSTRTDIYELGATIYTLLTGNVPADALHRMTESGDGEDDPLEPVNELVPTLPHHMAQAIHRAMSIKSNERFSTVEQFWQALTTPPDGLQQLVIPALVPPSTHPPIAPDPLSPPVVPDPPPPAPSQPLATPAIVIVRTQPRMSGFKKLVVLLLFLIAVVLGFGLETGLWSYIIHLRANHPTTVTSTPRSAISPTLTLSGTVTPNLVSPTARPIKISIPRPTTVPTAPPVVVPTHQPTVVATPLPKPTPTPTPIPYPNVAGSYNGSIDDTTENITTSMALSIQQKSGQGSISGNFTVGPALLGSGPFSGSVTTTKYIQFTVQPYENNAPLFFYGQVHPDSSLSGNYCSINAQNQCDPKAGDAGTWNVTRSSSPHTSLSSVSNSLQNVEILIRAPLRRWSDAASVAMWCGIFIFFSLCLLLLVPHWIRVARSRLHQ